MMAMRNPFHAVITFIIDFSIGLIFSADVDEIVEEEREREKMEIKKGK